MQLCNKCAAEKGIDAVIDIQSIGETLSPGEVWSGVICEGCEMIAIGKEDDGKLKIMKLNEEGTSNWETLD